jgi:hypothetical protein
MLMAQFRSRPEGSETGGIRVMVNVSDGIQAPTVRAVFPDRKAEVMPSATAVRKAQAMGLDLVLVAPTSGQGDGLWTFAAWK